MSPTIDNDAAGIGVDCPEKGAKCVVKADHENGRAKFFQVLGDEAHPKFFAGADDEDSEQQNDEVPLQSEKVGEASQWICSGRHRPRMKRFTCKNTTLRAIWM